MIRLIPGSWGSPVEALWGRLREFNPCHEPSSGQFAQKGQGNCAGGSTQSAQDEVRYDNDIARTPIHDDDVRDRIAALADVRRESFDLDTVLRIAGPAFAAGYRTLMGKVPAAHEALTKALESVVAEVGGEMVPYPKITDPGGVRASVGGIKGARRLIEKAVVDNKGDLAMARDVVRASIAVDHINDVPAVVEAVRRKFDVVREKPNFVKPTDAGYRDHMINIRLPNGLIGEIQVHIKPILKVKEGDGHRLYTKSRDPKVAPSMRQLLERRMAKLYATAWAIGSVGMAIDWGRLSGRT